MIDFLDFDEAERLLAEAANASEPWCVMAPIAALTGLRLGELKGLQRDDVDLVARRIHVWRGGMTSATCTRRRITARALSTPTPALVRTPRRLRERVPQAQETPGLSRDERHVVGRHG